MESGTGVPAIVVISGSIIIMTPSSAKQQQQQQHNKTTTTTSPKPSKSKRTLKQQPPSRNSSNHEGVIPQHSRSSPQQPSDNHYNSTTTDNDNDDDASSLSSIPLTRLKEHLQQQKQQKADTAHASPRTTTSTTTAATTTPNPTRKKSTATSTTSTTQTPSTTPRVSNTHATFASHPPATTPSNATSTVLFTNHVNGNKKITSHDKNSIDNNMQDNDNNNDDDDEEEAACCLCHCGVDCSDRALFFPKDRKQELIEEDGKYYFQLNDPYLPESLYDRNNALVYCDSCSRLYHQKCHFVPILVIPRGDWNCLICSLTKLPPPSYLTTTTNKNSKHTPQSRRRKKSTTAVASPSPHIPQSHSVLPDEPWKSFCDPSIYKQLFTSPPTPNARSLEQQWELATAIPKAKLWHQQLKQLETFLKSQASNFRMAMAALETLTSTKRNRAHFTNPFSSSAAAGRSKSSQELAQTLVRLTTAKWKIRLALLNLETIRISNPTTTLTGSMIHNNNNNNNNDTLPTSTGVLQQSQSQSQPNLLLVDWVMQYPSHEAHVFPHGRDLYANHRRLIPRTREMTALPPTPMPMTSTSRSDPLSMEIVVPSSNLSKTEITTIIPTATTTTPQQSISTLTKNTVTGKINSNNPTNNDNDSGISLDDLQCCVCFVGDATDENDVILCDGQGCCRAFHMKCVYPHVTPEDIQNEDEDWFCPLCRAISQFTATIQALCIDEEWEEEPQQKQHQRQGNKHNHNETSSLHSWNNIEKDVFPEAEWEYNSSLKFKAGKQNEDTVKLLERYLGDDFTTSQQKQLIPMPIGSDSEDENDYSLFDEESFEERRRKEREIGEKAGNNDSDNKNKDDVDDDDDNDDDDSDESTRSSQATLQDMSSVELKIGKSELAALSDVEDDSHDDSDNDADDDNASSNSNGNANGGRHRRRSRRLKNRTTAAAKSEQSSFADVGADFDRGNILEGKRRRKQVDYRKLNDALFGDLTAEERAQIDDKDDFQVKRKRSKSNTKKTPTTKRATSKSRKVSTTSSGDDEKEEKNKKLRRPLKRVKRNSKKTEESDSDNESSVSADENSQGSHSGSDDDENDDDENSDSDDDDSNES